MSFVSQLIAGTPIAYISAALAIALLVLIMGPGLPWMRARSEASSKRRRLVLVERQKIGGKRSVVLIRRDGVEHLLLTGGPQDIVVETFEALPRDRQPVTTVLRDGTIELDERLATRLQAAATLGEGAPQKRRAIR